MPISVPLSSALPGQLRTVTVLDLGLWTDGRQTILRKKSYSPTFSCLQMLATGLRLHQDALTITLLGSTERNSLHALEYDRPERLAPISQVSEVFAVEHDADASIFVESLSDETARCSFVGPVARNP